MREVNIALKQGVYRYDLNGTIVLYDREHGLNISNFDINNGEDVIEALSEIIQYEKQ